MKKLLIGLLVATNLLVACSSNKMGFEPLVEGWDKLVAYGNEQSGDLGELTYVSFIDDLVNSDKRLITLSYGGKDIKSRYLIPKNGQFVPADLVKPEDGVIEVFDHELKTRSSFLDRVKGIQLF